MAKKSQKEAPVAEPQSQESPQESAPVLPEWFVFEANRTILHPLGLTLSADADGRYGVVEVDEELKYLPEHFARGRAAYLQMMAAWGYDAHQKRKAALGYVVQEK